MIKNEGSKDELVATRSKSTVNILKQKISIALGKEKNQSLSKTVSKKTPSKITSSYLEKQRSMSMRSLARTTVLNQKEKSSVMTIKRKLSFWDHEPSSLKEKKQEIKNIDAFLSLNTSRTEKTLINEQKIDLKDTYSNLIWLDCSNTHNKLKIITKKSVTLGENLSESSVEYWVDNDAKSFVLFQIQQCKLNVIEKLHLSLLLYDQKSKKKQCFTGEKLNREFSLTFDGYIFICKTNQLTEKKDSIEKFNFLHQQINKLSEDGLNDFTILSKIVKRTFQSKFQSNKTQNAFFCLLIKVKNLKNLQEQCSTNFGSSPSAHKNTQQLLAQKLLIDKSGLPNNNLTFSLNQQSMKIKFTKKKFTNN